jgi:SPP1 gp7 family putative phage head morphogenesis protein
MERIMKQLAKKLAGLTNLGIILKTIKQFASSPHFKRYAYKEARRMVTHLATDNARSWREAAKISSKGIHIYQALKKELEGPIGGMINFQIQRNAEIIKSMPLSISKEIVKHVSSDVFEGIRSDVIAEDLQKLFPQITKSKAKLIARTETSKTLESLTKARCENLGLKWYQWNTSEDNRVRSSHAHMDKVLVNWNHPPSPEALIGEKNVGYYHAGNIYNCRCFSSPVISLDYIKWPHKVYYQGAIQLMSRRQFESIM